MIKIAFFRRPGWSSRGSRSQGLNPKAVLSGTVWALSIIVAALTVTGFWVMFSSQEVFYLSGLTSLITLAGVAAGGVISGRLAGGQGWLHGIIVGLIYVLVLTALTGLVSFQSLDWVVVFFHVLPLLLAGALGGILGVNLPVRRSVYRNARFPY